MTFTWPEALLLLALVPVIASVYVWMQKRRRRDALRYASVSLLKGAVGKGPGFKRHIPAALYLTALTLMIVALSRPTATIPVLVNTGIIILAIDVSGSMQAQDVQPDRLEATKAALRDFIENQPDGVKIGVVSFSDFGALVAPPDRDRTLALTAINRLRTERGTNMGGGLQVALDAIYAESDQAPPAAGGPPVAAADLASLPPASIVVISDGQSTLGPPPEQFAIEAQQAGVKIYTIGIGTPQGVVLQIRGRSVFTRLDEAILRNVADLTGGRYFNAQDGADLQQIYDELALERDFEDEETEVTFALTGVALIISVIAGGLGLVWFNRLP